MRFVASLMIVLFCTVGAVSAQETGPSISAIQGAGHISPYKRENVEGVVGVVTAVAPGTDFYMESVEPDGDPATSEGINVKGYRMPTIAVGDLVRVSGRVDEEYPGGPTSGNLSVTKILRARVEVISHDNELPAPAVIGVGGRRPPTRIVSDDADGLVNDSPFDPENDALDFYESVESMRVQLNDAVSVGTVHTVYGEIWVLPDGGDGASVRTARGGIVVREGDFNPERVLIDYLELPAIAVQDAVALPVVGDRFTAPIVGVMSYSFGNFKVRPTGQLPSVTIRGLPRESALPVGDPTVLSLGAFNVYNLSAADDSAKFADLAQTIVSGMAAPDIVVLSEVQDGDPTPRSEYVSSDLTIERLIGSIVDAGGPADYRYTDIAPDANRDGGAPGGNIRVGFLYRSDRVELVPRPGGDATTAATIRAERGEAALYPSPARIAPDDRAFGGSRKPLVAEFRFRGSTVFVVGNHFNSKGGDGYVFGQVQPPTFGSETKRMLQAEAVRLFVEEIQAVDPQALVVVAGDLNDFVFSAPLRTLEGADNVLLNLAEELLPESEIYSYIYEGNSQVLDHILVSRSLFERSEPTVQFVHRYSEYLYEDRHSDHDPILARFRLE